MPLIRSWAVLHVGGTVHDVRQLAGHANLVTTQGSIETDAETRRKLVALL
jgi:hypothetical protein